MSGWARVAALLLLAHVLTPFVAVVIVVEVATFVLTLGVLARLAWTGRAVAPVWRTAGKAAAR